jgi:hypothetical protein
MKGLMVRWYRNIYRTHITSSTNIPFLCLIKFLFIYLYIYIYVYIYIYIYVRYWINKNYIKCTVIMNTKQLLDCIQLSENQRGQI